LNQRSSRRQSFRTSRGRFKPIETLPKLKPKESMTPLRLLEQSSSTSFAYFVKSSRRRSTTCASTTVINGKTPAIDLTDWKMGSSRKSVTELRKPIRPSATLKTL